MACLLLYFYLFISLIRKIKAWANGVPSKNILLKAHFGDMRSCAVSAIGSSAPLCWGAFVCFFVGPGGRQVENTGSLRVWALSVQHEAAETMCLTFDIHTPNSTTPPHPTQTRAQTHAPSVTGPRQAWPRRGGWAGKRRESAGMGRVGRILEYSLLFLTYSTFCNSLTVTLYTTTTTSSVLFFAASHHPAGPVRAVGQTHHLPSGLSWPLMEGAERLCWRWRSVCIQFLRNILQLLVTTMEMTSQRWKASEVEVDGGRVLPTRLHEWRRWALKGSMARGG